MIFVTFFLHQSMRKMRCKTSSGFPVDELGVILQFSTENNEGSTTFFILIFPKHFSKSHWWWLGHLLWQLDMSFGSQGEARSHRFGNCEKPPRNQKIHGCKLEPISCFGPYENDITFLFVSGYLVWMTWHFCLLPAPPKGAIYWCEGALDGGLEASMTCCSNLLGTCGYFFLSTKKQLTLLPTNFSTYLEN